MDIIKKSFPELLHKDFTKIQTNSQTFCENVCENSYKQNTKIQTDLQKVCENVCTDSYKDFTKIQTNLQTVQTKYKNTNKEEILQKVVEETEGLGQKLTPEEARKAAFNF
jgi:uncharacterized protein YpuA (DUF1002 family)